MKELFAEQYANVMLIDTTMNLYLVHRSFTGTLYTDGKGNYSTSRIDGATTTLVPDWTQSSHEIKCEKRKVEAKGEKSVWEKVADGRFKYVGNGSMADNVAWWDKTGPLQSDSPNFIPYTLRVTDHANKIVYRAATEAEADEKRGYTYGNGRRHHIGTNGVNVRPAQSVVDVPKLPAASTPSGGSSGSPTASVTTDILRTNSEEARAAIQNKFVQPTSQDLIDTVTGRATAAAVIVKRRAGTPDLSLVADAALVAAGEGL
jgi:hypothetical protein